MSAFLPLSLPFLANLSCFLQLRCFFFKKRFFSVPLPCEKPTQTTGKTGYLYAEPSTATAERLSHRQQPKKTGRKIDFSLQPFQTHDLETYYSNSRQKGFFSQRRGWSPFVSSLRR